MFSRHNIHDHHIRIECEVCWGIMGSYLRSGGRLRVLRDCIIFTTTPANHQSTYSSPKTWHSPHHPTKFIQLFFIFSIFLYLFSNLKPKERSCCAATKFLVSRRNYISASSISISSENGKFKSRLPEDFGDVTVRDLRYVPALSDISDISQISINPPHPHLATKLHSASTEMVKLKSSQMRNE